jgi:hypothetical protein
MARARAILHDPDRKLMSDVLMDGQVLAEDIARALEPLVRRTIRQSAAVRRAQERLTASELRAEREAWDGLECRRRSDRRAA